MFAAEGRNLAHGCRQRPRSSGSGGLVLAPIMDALNLRHIGQVDAARKMKGSSMDRTLVAGLRALAAVVAGLLLAGSGHSPAADKEELPPNLGTRPVGDDWPGMLGRHGDSKSPELGLVTP